MSRLPLVVLALACAGAARAEGAIKSVGVGFKGSTGREAAERSYEWGPTLSAELLASAKDARTRLKYEIELNYDDSFSKLESGGTTQSSRVRTTEFKYGKLSLLQAFGYDLKEKLRFVPYVSGGYQYVDSRTDTDGELAHDFYWAPTYGAGIEFSLTKRTTLALDYDANTLRGDRRIAHLSLELKVAILGDPEE